jgi:branched-chain amino acid transport system permease protein
VGALDLGLGPLLDLVAAAIGIGGIYAVVAVGLNLQYGLMRIMNVAHGEFLMVGAYLAYALRVATGLGPLWALPLVAGAELLLGLGLYRLLFRRLVRTSPSAEALEGRSLIASFGLAFVVQNVVLLIFGADLRGYEYLARPLSLGGGVLITANRVVVFGVVALLTVALAAVLRATMVGKAVRAMLQAPLGAVLVGIDTRRLHPLCFGVGLALSGVAGVLLSMVFQLSPAMGQPYTVTALIVITLGGMGSMLGSLVGGVLLGFVETFGTQLTSPSTRMLFAYGTLVLVLLVRPRGVLAR